MMNSGGNRTNFRRLLQAKLAIGWRCLIYSRGGLGMQTIVKEKTAIVIWRVNEGHGFWLLVPHPLNARILFG